jgi:RNA polymerase I-specific transcription initiation factor RRN6
MADQDWNGLPYGHFGNAFYQSEEQAWQFERIPDQPRILELVEGSEVAVPSQILPPSEPTKTAPSGPPHALRDKQIAELIKSAPTLQPGSSLLRPLLGASEAIEDATRQHDPLRGQLLSFGRVFDESTRRSTQLVAFVAGSTGSDVRVAQVQLQKQGWDDSRDVWLEVPVVIGEETTWKSEGSPIQQICFAQPLESGENLLAVRTNSRVSIFKPILREAGPMRLRLRLLFERSTGQNESVPHADAAFNPWFPRQFAMVDQHAQWRVWEFRSRESSDATCICSSQVDEENPPKNNLDDGWARLLWVCNPNTVVVAKRRSVQLFDVNSGAAKLQDIDVKASDVSSWVLDIATAPTNPAQLFVLTTTHLYLFNLEERDGEVRAKLSMRVRHFRSPEDITLRLTLFRDEDALTVIIRSALSPSLVTYHLSVDEHQIMRLHDPAQFSLDPNISEGTSGANVHEFHMQSVATNGKRSADIERTFAGRLRKDDHRFIALTILKSDLSLASALYMNRHSQAPTERHLHPSWRGGLIGTSAKIKDSFVVDDEFVVTDGADPKIEPVPSYIKQRRQRAKLHLGNGSTVQYKRIANKIERRPTEAENVDEVLLLTRDLLGKSPEPGVAPMQTLLELSMGELNMSDMDQVSAEIQRLTTMEHSHLPSTPDDAEDADHSTRVVLRPVEHISLLGQQSTKHLGPDIIPTYDAIVSHWITPLPPQVPGRVRLAKEQHARRIAAELALASHVLRVEDIEEPTETQEDARTAGSQKQSWDLPMHIASSQMTNPYLSQLQSQSQSALPTPSPTGTPSITTASFSTRTSLSTSASLSHLKNYTTFTKPPPPTLPRSLAKILNHWTLGSDPDKYDWVATSRTISQQTREEEADSQLTEKQRARAHRKAERHIRRQRKEAQASQVQMLASSQMPELVVSASQPQAVGGGARGEGGGGGMKPYPYASMGRHGSNRFGSIGMVGSSQSQSLGGGPAAAASQAVAGRFGGRPPAKKKRKQGF